MLKFSQKRISVKKFDKNTLKPLINNNLILIFTI